jgi:hypothetical protein
MHAGVSCEGIGCATIQRRLITFHGLAKQRDLFVHMPVKIVVCVCVCDRRPWPLAHSALSVHHLVQPVLFPAPPESTQP